MTQDLYNLILKVLSGNSTEAESAEVNAWRKALPEHESMYREAERFWTELGKSRQKFQPDTEKAWKEFQRKLVTAPKRRSPMLRMAAILVIVLGLGAVVAILLKPKAVIDQQVEEKYTEKYNEKRGVQKRYHTDKDSVAEVVLPDSSIVLLNENSALTAYEPEKGSAGQLSLKGTAYFSLLPSRHGYTIATHDLMLGSSGSTFSVNEDAEKGITEISVEEGQVSVHPKHQRKDKVIDTAGETYVYDANTKEVKVESTKHHNSWWKRFTGRLKHMIERMKKHHREKQEQEEE